MVGAPHRVSEVVGAVVGALGPSTPKGEGGASHSVGLHLPVSPDGQRFLMLKVSANPNAPSAPPARITVVENWQEELKRLAPAK
jgi:hypothetical protein